MCSCSPPHKSQRSPHSRWPVAHFSNHQLYDGSFVGSRTGPGEQKNKSFSTFTRVRPRGPPSFLRSTNMVSISFPSHATSLFLSPSYWHNRRKRNGRAGHLFDPFMVNGSKDFSPFTSSINLAWPPCSIGLIAFCSKPTEPGYSIRLPKEWAMRKLKEKRKKNITALRYGWNDSSWIIEIIVNYFSIWFIVNWSTQSKKQAICWKNNMFTTVIRPKHLAFLIKTPLSVNIFYPKLLKWHSLSFSWLKSIERTHTRWHGMVRCGQSGGNRLLSLSVWALASAEKRLLWDVSFHRITTTTVTMQINIVEKASTPFELFHLSEPRLGRFADVL